MDIDYKIDKAAPNPDFDVVSKPVIFDTDLKNIEFEYEGYMPEIIADINQINEDIIELSSYSGWYPKPVLSGTTFDFDIKLNLPCGYELASNGTIYNNIHITSTGDENDDIVLFASNKVRRIIIDEGLIKLIFLCPDEMLPDITNRAKDIAKANSYFAEKYGEIKIQSATKKLSAFSDLVAAGDIKKEMLPLCHMTLIKTKQNILEIFMNLLTAGGVLQM